MPEIATIGYQEASAAAVLAALASADVGLLVDVRAVAASRRPGFSKRQLAAGVEGMGIGYLHLRALGTPAAGRLAARTGRYDDLRRIYRAHLATDEARVAMAELAELIASRRRVCLLCFERLPEHCHRRQIVEALGERLAVEVIDLLP